MEASRSVPKRPGAPQKSPGMSQSTLQRAPGTLQDVPKRRRVSGRAFANGLQEIRDVSGKALQRTHMPKCLHIARRSSVPERPRSLQECLRAPSSGQAPFKMSQSVLECLTWPLPMASKISGMCLGRLYNGPECPNVCTWLASRVLLTPPCFHKSLSKSFRSRASPMA